MKKFEAKVRFLQYRFINALEIIFMQRQQTNYFGRDLEAMSFAVNYHRWIFREFRNYIGKHVVEVGAGTGTFSQLILKTNPSTFVAIEPSTNMYESLRDRIGGNPNVRILNCHFANALPKFSQAPDTVFYVNVLEHIEDDQGELDCVCRSLRPNGHLCIFVPALGWLYGTHDKAVGHLRRYEKEALARVFKQAGFEIVLSKYFDIAGILPWWISFCVLKRPPLQVGQAKVYDSILVPVMERLERIARPPIGKNLMFVGRKP